MPNKASELITKGVMLLLRQQPFYASLILPMDITESTLTNTAATDGKDIIYNAAFIETLNIREVAGLLVHELLHIANFHHTRRGSRDPEKWNIACDYAINPIILEADMILPEGGLFREEFKSMTAEKIYDKLPNNCSFSKLRVVNIGQVKDAPGKEGPQGAEEARVQQALSQAMLAARLRGAVSESIERLVSRALEPYIDWRSILAQFVTEIARDDYTWRKPSPRYICRRLYLPPLESLRTGGIILIVDTSGSIEGDLLDQFASEIKSIADTFNIALKVIYVDAKVNDVQDFDIGEDIQLKPKGGGGTDFRPGFDYINLHDLHPRAVVYFTDGECSRFATPPDYPVLWAQFGAADFRPPYGEVVHVTKYL